MLNALIRGVIGWWVEEGQGVTALATGRLLVGVRKRVLVNSCMWVSMGPGLPMA